MPRRITIVPGQASARSMGSREDEELLNKSRKRRKLSWAPPCWYIVFLPGIKARYVLVVMLSLGYGIVYALRVNLSVAIVQMTAKHPHHGQR